MTSVAPCPDSGEIRDVAGDGYEDGLMYLAAGVGVAR